MRFQLFLIFPGSDFRRASPITAELACVSFEPLGLELRKFGAFLRYGLLTHAFMRHELTRQTAGCTDF